VKNRIITRDVAIYYSGGELLVERADDSMTVVLTVEEALALVKTDDKRRLKGRIGGVVTRITWHDLPQYLTTKVGK
jgi:hypothetical protein